MTTANQQERKSVPLVVEIRDGVVYNAPTLCTDAGEAEKVFSDLVRERIPAANSWDAATWQDALENGYVELDAVNGSICLCWADPF